MSPSTNERLSVEYFKEIVIKAFLFIFSNYSLSLFRLNIGLDEFLQIFSVIKKCKKYSSYAAVFWLTFYLFFLFIDISFDAKWALIPFILDFWLLCAGVASVFLFSFRLQVAKMETCDSWTTEPSLQMLGAWEFLSRHKLVHFSVFFMWEKCVTKSIWFRCDK